MPCMGTDANGRKSHFAMRGIEQFFLPIYVLCLARMHVVDDNCSRGC